MDHHRLVKEHYYCVIALLLCGTTTAVPFLDQEEPSLIQINTPSARYEQKTGSTARIYAPDLQRWIVYDITHSFWTKRSANVNRITRAQHQMMVKKIMKIYWTMDETNMTDHMRFILPRQGSQPWSNRLVFVDATDTLSSAEKLSVIRDTFQELFDDWSSVLCHRLIFQYIPYTDLLQQQRQFYLVVVVAMRNYRHRHEHAELLDDLELIDNSYEFEQATRVYSHHDFDQPSNLAHAHYNYVHFNGQYHHFYLAPYRLSRSIYLQTAFYHQGVRHWRLSKVDTQRLAEHYGINYVTFYQENREVINQLAHAQTVGDQRYLCLACVMLHEVGHLLGLGHVYNSSESVMGGYTHEEEPIIRSSDQQMMRTFFAPFLRNTGQSVTDNCF